MNEYESKPCKCGIKHEHGDGNYELYDMRMTSELSPIQIPPRKTARCKFCKETLLLIRKKKNENEEKKRDVLDSIFLKHHNIPSSFTNTFG